MGKCIFCGIVNGGVDCKIVYEDEKVTAFKDINPAARVHVLIIPREHIEGIKQAHGKDPGLIGHIMRAAADIAEEENITNTGYRVLVNSGPDAGQAINHLHFHLLGGEKLKAI